MVRTTPEEIKAKLREVELRRNRGETVAEAVKAAGIGSRSKYYTWRERYSPQPEDEVASGDARRPLIVIDFVSLKMTIS